MGRGRSYSRVFALIVLALVSSCAHRTITPAPRFSACDSAASRDATYILGVPLQPHHHLSKPPQIVYAVQAPTGIAYVTYLTTNGTCSLTHLDARWQRHDRPLVFYLRGGRLRTAILRRKSTHAQLVMVDRWGRASTTTLMRAFPVGLTLWEETNTDLLHVALATRWQSEAGADILVDKNGPVLFPTGEQATPPPREWDVDHHAFMRRQSAYQP